MDFLLFFSVVAFLGLETDARQGQSPTGIFYHRITTFMHGNEIDNMYKGKVNSTNARALCQSVGKDLPRLNSQRELDDLIGELNSMEAYGNTMFCGHNDVNRRFWLDHRMNVLGQYSGGFQNFADLNDNGPYCAALFWRDPTTGYLLNGQPCTRRQHTMCVRNKFYREIHRERFDYIDYVPLNNPYNGRFNHALSNTKCQHYGKQMVSVSSTQDVLDLQEELNRIGLIEDKQERNFWLADQVNGQVGFPADVNNLVSGTNCLSVGQKYASNVLGRISPWYVPCTRYGYNNEEDERSEFIALCTDDEPGRYYGKIQIHFVLLNKPAALTYCQARNKVLPSINSDEDVMDLGREIKRIDPDTYRYHDWQIWTSQTTDVIGNQYWFERGGTGSACALIRTVGPVKEIWKMVGDSCSNVHWVACMDP